jgi:glycosyltransferase involved in cell wall biosynthesis
MSPRIASRKVSIFLQKLPGGGGAERMMLNLASGILEKGIDVDLVCGHVMPVSDFAFPPNVGLVNLGTGRTLVSVLPLAKYLRQEQPSALLSAMTHVNVAAVLAGLLAGRRTRVIVSERSTISQQPEYSLAARAARGLVPWVYSRADGIVAVSRGTAEDLASYSGLPLDRIRVINNPAVTGKTRQLAEEPVDHPWFGPEQPPVILAVGRLSAEKDFATLIKAFAAVRQRQPARLVIMGDGRERQALEAIVAKLCLDGQVDFTGFKQNPHSYMARAAVLALTSKREGSPNVLVEAMACGTPVVATDCPSGPYDILEGGRLGRLVPVGDAEQLGAAILDTLNDPVPSECLRRRAEDFSVERSVESYLEILLGNGSPFETLD